MIAPDKSEREIKIKDERSLHLYQIKYSEPGTYGLVAETRPGYFAMRTDKRGRKRHSLKPLHTFIDNAVSVESSMRSSQWAETYVVCETPSDNFPADLGLPFELVSKKDPTTLNEGESISFTVMSNGKPYEGVGYWDAAYGGFSTESEGMYIQRTEIVSGKFTVPVEHSGRWFICFFTKTDAAEDVRDQYLTEKRTATITFPVRNKRRRLKISDH